MFRFLFVAAMALTAPPLAAAGMEGEVSMFGGQGIPSGQLAELRRVSVVPAVKQFLAALSTQLAVELCGLPAGLRAQHLEQGLDISAWAGGKFMRMEYLSGLPVSMVLTLVAQLATYRYCWARTAAPAETAAASTATRVPSAAAVGHSQGMAAAMVVALSTDVNTFTAHAWTFVRTLLHFGLAAAEHLRLLVPAEAGEPPAGPRAGDCALALLKVPVPEVRALAAAYNNLAAATASPAAVGPAAAVVVAVENGAEACLISGEWSIGQVPTTQSVLLNPPMRPATTGLPSTLVAFRAHVQRWAAGCGRPLKVHSLPVRAPFHCRGLLASTAAACADRLGKPVGSECLVRPLWSCVDGRRLDGASGAISGESLQAFLLEALASKPVDWPATLRAVARFEGGCPQGDCWAVDYGPGGGSLVARISAVVVKEHDGSGPLGGLKVEYFTQRHCSPGPLPASWLAWLKAPEAGGAGAGAEPAVEPAGPGGAVRSAIAGAVHSPATKGRRGFSWFSDRLKSASAG